MGILKQRGVEGFTAVFAGEIEKPDYLAEIKRTAERLGVGSRLRFPGNVADMAAGYLAADVLLNISEAEGLPRVALEAQAMGVPVIVSDTGPGREVALSAPDVPAAEATGLRVPFARPDALADTLGDFLSWPEAKRRAMGERAAQHVRGRYSLERLTGATLEVYREVLQY
jgi:glycosyltransferase involved in cell wall biosynthesis